MDYKESSLVKNAFILSSAAILSKVVGAFYQAFLYQVVGSVGVGIYMKGSNFYAMLLAVSASGIPIAISKLMSEERAKGNHHAADRIFSYSTLILTILGVIFSFGMYLMAPFIADEIFRDPRTVYVLQAMSPALLVVTVMGAFRGYFQGKQYMVPTAVSQIVEQIARVAFSVVITLYILRITDFIPVIRIINGVALGPFIGSMFGISVLILFLLKDRGSKHNIARDKHPVNNMQIIKKIILFAIPVTLSALLPTLMDVVEGVIIPNNLAKSGFNIAYTDSFYGSFSGAVMGLVNLIVSVSAAFAISIVPAIAAAQGRNNHEEVVRKLNLSLKMVCLISIPSGLGLIFLGEPILDLIFNAGDAINILRYSVLMVIFIGLYHNTTGILQGLGRTYIPIISLTIGLFFNVVFLNLLMPHRIMSVMAAPIAYTTAYLVAFIINYTAIRKEVKFTSNWMKWLPKVVVSSMVTAVVAYVFYHPLYRLFLLFMGHSLSQLISLLISITIAFIAYVFSLILTKGLTRDEAYSIPKLSGLILKVNRLVGDDDNEK